MDISEEYAFLYSGDEEDICIDATKPKQRLEQFDAEFAEDSFKMNVLPSKVRKFTEADITKITADLYCSCVNDFGVDDDYHLTDAQRETNEDIRSALQMLRKANIKYSYNRPADYIIAMRVVLDVIEVVSKYNYLYSPEKFRKLVMKGKIICPNIPIPKIKKWRKKGLSMDYISELILSPDINPYEIFVKRTAEVSDTDDDYDLDDPDELDAYRHKLFTDEQYDKIFGTSYENDYVDIPDTTIKEIDKLSDNNDIANAIDTYKIIQSDTKKNYASMINPYLHDNKDFEDIARRDKMLHGVDNDMPKFKGSINKSSSVKRYAYQVNRYIDELRGDLYTYRTNADINDAEVYRLFEASGWNVKKMKSSKEIFNKEKDDNKRIKRKEEAVKKRLLEAGAVTDNGGKKKKKNKKHKKEDTFEDYHQKFKSRSNERLDSEISDIIGDDYDTYDEYTSDMQDFNKGSWNK